jgi:hypothetical protein
MIADCSLFFLGGQWRNIKLLTALVHPSDKLHEVAQRQFLHRALNFLNSAHAPIIPRKRFPGQIANKLAPRQTFSLLGFLGTTFAWKRGAGKVLTFLIESRG